MWGVKYTKVKRLPGMVKYSDSVNTEFDPNIKPLNDLFITNYNLIKYI